MKDAIDGIRHHYASDSGARASISQYLQIPDQTIIPGIVCKKEGRFLRLYPVKKDIPDDDMARALPSDNSEGDR